MGLLDGDLARSMYNGFRGKLLRGVLRQRVVPSGTALDDHGDPATVPVDTPIEGFTDAYSAFTRATAGIPATDVRLSIFAASMPGKKPAIGNQARLDRKGVPTWYQIKGPVDIDPAGVLWECQSFEIKAPS